jgi:autotransporter-associated beta strand protein
VTIQVNAGGALTDTVTGSFAPSTSLLINAGGSVNTFGVDTFASLAGAGTISIPSTNAVFFGNASSTAFSGTLVAPDLNTAFVKQGTGNLTINGMTAANGDILETQGSITQSAGTTSIKSLAVGTGTGNTANMTVSGGTLTFTGTGLVGIPCSSQCPALRVGDFAGTGLLTQTAGTIIVGAPGVAGSMNIGNQGGNGTYTISGGILQLGVLGDVNTAGLYSIGRQATANPAFANSTGVLNIAGTGLVDVQAGELINGDRDAGGAAGALTSSTINMTGGTLRIRSGANLWLSAFNNTGAIDSVFNLNGGTLEIGDGRLQANYGGGGGVYQFNLGNGTIKVIDSALVTSVDGILTGGSATTGVKVDTNGIGATWNGVLSGTGWLVKTGAGTLNLGGVNTYTGGTAFNGGTVLVDSLTDLGANSAALSFNGGTLQLGANSTLINKAGVAVTMAGAGTIDTNGFSTFMDGNISGSGALTKAGLGTLDIAGANNGHTGALNVLAGSLTASAVGGNHIGDTSAVTVSAGATLNVGPETIGSLAGAGLVNITAGSTLTTGGDNTSTIWTGTTGATTGALTKVGVGTFTINANTLYTGLTTVGAGELRLNGSLADSLLIASGARFSGNATVNGSVTNNGAINPGNSPGTTTIIGNYTAGLGAVLNMEVQFNNAAAPVNGVTNDFISIGGNASGVTLINVIPSAPSNAAVATTGNGVELVRVAGTNNGTQFALSGPVFQGGLQYVLDYKPNYSGVLDGYFLRSQIGEGLFGDAAMFSAGRAMTSSCFMGVDGLSGDGTRTTSGRAWARAGTGNLSTGADSGIVSEQDYTCGSGGVDLRVADNTRIGVSGGYGHTNVDVSTLAGMGRLDGDGGTMQAYMGFAHEGLFANLSVGVASISWTFDGPLTALTDATTRGVIASLQGGVMWPLGDDWRFGAMAEVGYDGMTCTKHCLLAGTTEDPANWTAKGTLRIDGRMADGVLLPFISVALSDTLDGTDKVTNGAGSLSTSTASSLLTAKAGLSAMVADNTALFAQVGVTSGLSKDVDGMDGSGGIKIFW